MSRLGEYDPKTKEKRIERCPNLLRVFTNQVLETAFFSDEKIFKVTQLLNVQNDRTYAPSAYKKSTIENKRLYVERSGFPMNLMVSVAVSKLGKLSIFFFEPGAKVNGAYYREKLLASMIPEMDRLTGYQPYVFMQYGARPHTAKETVRFLNQQPYLTWYPDNCPNGHNPEWTQSRMDTIPNGHNPEWTQSRMDTIPNGHNPEWTQSRMDTIPNGHNPEWTQSRMDTIPNGHHPEWTPSRMDTIPKGHNPE